MKKRNIYLILIISIILIATTIIYSTRQKQENNYNIDYLVLVNKLNALPENWEKELKTIHFTNSIGDDVEVEINAYDAYLKLKEELEKENVYVDLDSARRSIEAQQKIMDDFTEKYGADYAIKTVAKPGYSEHHTGLALDLYLIVDGKDIIENEDLVQYPELWSIIHEKLAKYGFILRYLQDKEHITGYAYEPWHIRYIKDVDIAKEITDKAITLESYLGATKETEPVIDLGSSDIYSTEELKEMAILIKCQFASWKNCELQRIRYASDREVNQENLDLINLDTDQYINIAQFLMDFHSSKESTNNLEADHEYKDYKWWLGQSKDGSWEVVKHGN